MTARAEPDIGRHTLVGCGTILENPLVAFGPEVTSVLDAALHREWLVTHGLGGYAPGTVAGVNTRRYHGMLVAALKAPYCTNLSKMTLDSAMPRIDAQTRSSL